MSRSLAHAGLIDPPRTMTHLSATPAGSHVNSRVVALVPAAGQGLRMGGPIAKQFLSLAGLPLIVHALRVLQSSPVIENIILAVPATDRQYCLDHIVVPHGFYQGDENRVRG